MHRGWNRRGLDCDRIHYYLRRGTLAVSFRTVKNKLASQFPPPKKLSLLRSRCSRSGREVVGECLFGAERPGETWNSGFQRRCETISPVPKRSVWGERNKFSSSPLWLHCVLTISGFNVSYQEKPNFMLCSALVHRPVVESGVFRELVSNLLFFFLVFCLVFTLYGLNVDIKLNLSSSDYFSFEGLLKAWMSWFRYKRVMVLSL